MWYGDISDCHDWSPSPAPQPPRSHHLISLSLIHLISFILSMNFYHLFDASESLNGICTGLKMSSCLPRLKCWTVLLEVVRVALLYSYILGFDMRLRLFFPFLCGSVQYVLHEIFILVSSLLLVEKRVYKVPNKWPHRGNNVHHVVPITVKTSYINPSRDVISVLRFDIHCC